jgi:pimeloyl-ACP methyl ester carboxylesterase
MRRASLLLAFLLAALPAPSHAELPDVWTTPAGDVREVGLHVRVLGNGSPTVLLLHGVAGSNRYFGGAFDALADEARVIAPDLLGFGDSPRPSDVDYGLQAHAEALAAALDRLGIHGPIFIVAHSAGSIVALRLAALRPAQVRGIVALAPPFYRSETAARDRIREQRGMVRFFASNGWWNHLACRSLRTFPDLAGRLARKIRGDLPKPIVADAMKHSWSSYSGTVQNLVLRPQPPTDLERLRIPVWLIAGTEDELLDVDFLNELANSHPLVELQIWSGGHDLPLRDASRSVELIRNMMTASAASSPISQVSFPSARAR